MDTLKAQNGAKLKQVELSDTQNVLPTGAMHKNKHHLDDIKDRVTGKGIPVISVEDGGEITSYEDILTKKDSIVQHAEIESREILINKELTNYLEDAKKKWEENHDPDLALEVGMRMTKEILFNTTDREKLIKTQLKATVWKKE